MTRPRARAVAIATLVVAMAQGTAWAAWLGTGSGAATTASSSLGTPSAPSASASGSSVTLTWSAVSIGGLSTASGYVVRRYAGAAEATVGASCAGIVAALTCTETGVAGGTWTYTITAAKGSWRSPQSAASSSVTVSVAPTIGGATIGKSAGGIDGFIHQGGTYYVYANVSGTGTITVTANVATVTAGQTAAALSSGSWTVRGTAYGYRSALLTADATLAAGTKSFSIAATNGSSASASFSVTVDNTSPSATDIQTTNSGVAGRITAGDTIVYTANEPFDAASLLTGWDGASIAVTIDVQDLPPGDRVTIFDGTNTTQVGLGTIKLGRTDFVTANVSVPATMVLSGSTVVITIGTPPASGITTAAGTGSMQWTPVTTATDRAGNALGVSPLNETGAADVDF